MLVNKLELFLLGTAAFDEFADHSQPVRSVSLGDPAGLFDGRRGMAMPQTVRFSP